jgi:hypothetical protein
MKPASHDPEHGLWRKHAFWRGLQKVALWLALLSPIILLFLPVSSGYHIVVVVWLAAVFGVGVAHFFRKSALAQLRHQHKHNPYNHERFED